MSSAIHQPVRVRVTAAVLLTLILCLPWLTTLSERISPISYASEALGYRYFHSYRLLHGDKSPIWEAQGQTLGVLHHGINLLIDGVLVRSNSDLRARIDLFSHLTLAANALLLAAILLAAAANLRLTRNDLLILGGVSIFGVFGSGWSLQAAASPDYYLFEITANVASLWLTLAFIRAEHPGAGIRRGIALGAFAATLACLKITLLPAALLPAAVVFARARHAGFRVLLFGLGGWLLGFLAGAALIVSAYYLFDLRQMGRAFALWRQFVAHPGVIEPTFWNELLRRPLEAGDFFWTDHRFAVVISAVWASTLVLSALLLRQSPAARLNLFLLCFLCVSVALHAFGLAKRPAATTLFEFGLFLAVSAGTMLAMLTPGSWRAIPGTCFAAILLAWSGVSLCRWVPSSSMFERLRQTGENAWQIHGKLISAGVPVLIYIPDNNFTSGSVEDAILKGFSDVPTWNITSGYAPLQNIAPNFRFVQWFSGIPEGQMFVWTDLAGRTSLAEQSPALSYSIRSKGAALDSWPMWGGPAGATTVHALFVPEDRSSWSSALGNGRFQGSTPLDPIAGFSLSPQLTGAVCELRKDEHGRTCVRITATRSSPFLALTSPIPPMPNAVNPLRILAEVRLNKPRSVQIQVDSDDSGYSEEPYLPSGAWIRLQVERPRPKNPQAAGYFWIGLKNVEAGDWFEVAEMDLLVPAQ
jgi:hypothetical protein